MEMENKVLFFTVGMRVCSQEFNLFEANNGGDRWVTVWIKNKKKLKHGKYLKSLVF